MKRFSALICAAVLLCTAAGCARTPRAAQREDSGGTGYGVTQRSILQLQDLYFFQRNISREQVQAALGSPHTYVLSGGNRVRYRLADGSSLDITYNKNEVVEAAAYTDALGEEHDLFAYLAELGVLKNAGGKKSGQEPDPAASAAPAEPDISDPPAAATNGAFFSTGRYAPDIAAAILKVGARRESVLSALGKPNSFSSVNFAADSYLIDVYVLEDGTVLQVDYGYKRTTLRAVRQVQGSYATDYAGSWGAEEKPVNFLRQTRNLNLFGGSLKKGATPAAFYEKYGEPDWYEGTADAYHDAYLLNNGAVLLVNFGTAHNSLVAASVRQADGKVTVFPVK